MKKTTITAAAAMLLIACSTSKPIAGTITVGNGDSVTVNNTAQFKILKPAQVPSKGDTATFTPTRDKRKVNAKKIRS